jgi:predicted RNA-binding protein YlqC (UPF0109 family)
MEDLIRHLVEPAVSNPEAVQVSAVEGEDVVLLKLSVDPADRGIFDEDGDRTLRSIRTIVSAAAGSNKASVELVSEDEQAEDADDDTSDDDTSDEDDSDEDDSDDDDSDEYDSEEDDAE